MDVTPQLIEQIDFSEKFRGYDPDQVDDFLERVGATIAELSKTSREALQRAERAEAELRNAPEPSRAPAAVMSDEEEAMQSTRTLMMAKRTADAAIADARQEAQKLVADARATAEQQQREAQTEADRIVGEARVNADQMTQKATAEANREYGIRRDQILAEIGELENRKVGMAGQLLAIESRLDEYRAGLGTIHGAIGSILDNPEAALRSPLPGVDVASIARSTVEPAAVQPAAFESSAFESSAFESSAFDARPEPVADTSSTEVADPAPVETAAFETGAFETGAFESAAFEPVAFDAPAEPAFADAFTEPSSDDAFDAGRGSHFGDATLLDPDELAVPYAETGGTELLASAELAWSDDERADDAPAADPWGPGSWGEVSAFTEAPVGFASDGEAFDDANATAAHAFSEFPSDGLPVIGQDRYNRDLDQAVNQPDEHHDDAMSAFFEGDDDPQTRRFGRRR